MNGVAALSFLFLSLYQATVDCRETTRRTKHLFAQRTRPVRGSSLPIYEIRLSKNGSIATEESLQDHSHISSRSKRSSRKKRSPISSPHESVHNFNDSHNMLYVQWSGFNSSDTVVVLSKDQHPNSKSTSYLYVSNDYGKTYTNQSGKLQYPKGGHNLTALIDGMYNSPLSPRSYIFTDITNNVIFYSTDDCDTLKPVVLKFTPDIITFHPKRKKSLLAYDETLMTLYYSRDFGETWSERENKVKSFNWGIQDLDSYDTIYLEMLNSYQTSDIYRGHYDHKHPYFKQKVISNVSDFEIKDNYTFATMQNGNGLDLYVSYHYHNFEIASFPSNKTNQDYIIADASEGQVFVAINHNKNTTHLYVSDSTGKKYALSMERVLYYNPLHRTDTWLRRYMNETFIDFHAVASMRGVYLASQVSVGAVGTRYIYTRITYNKGAYWVRLRAPRYHHDGSRVNCSYWMSQCSLHLVQRFASSHPYHSAPAVTSKQSAPGLIVSSGNLGKNLKYQTNLYISNDAGYSWREALQGRYFFNFGDHGGVIVAVRQWSATKQLHYSLDEGVTWQAYNFSTSAIRVYGVLTETGEKTTIFSVFGSYASGGHRWIVVQVDFRDVFAGKCMSKDYETWSPEDVGYGRSCILGEKLVFERRKQYIQCYNGRNYDRPISRKSCYCAWTDFECDEGFYQSHQWYYCTVDPSVSYNPEAPPRPCPPGQTYNKTQGYRKIAGDKCVNGSSIWYLPYEESCPFELDKAFLVYASFDSIKYYDLATSNHTTKIVGLRGAVAVAYDIKDGYVYWADMQDHRIFRQMLNQTDERKTIAGIKQIEGMDLDWTTGYLYWVDSKEKVIEVCRKDGLFRKTIHSSDLDKPRSIALDPPNGEMFWSDWGNKAKIEKSDMDGANRKILIIGDDKIVWPNGLAIDIYKPKTGKVKRIMYWTDAKLDKIGSYDLETGTETIFAAQKGDAFNHPYSIAVDDRYVYWDDWASGSVYMLSKSGIGIPKVLIKGKKYSNKRKYEIKVYYNRTQKDKGRCSNHGCPQLCLPKYVGFTCACGDDMDVDSAGQCKCKGGLTLYPNGTCARQAGQHCAANEFPCKTNKRCIPLVQTCDGRNDCGDYSDEMMCNITRCSIYEYPCPTGSCIPISWKCNGRIDCVGGADEEGCEHHNCNSRQIRCRNGRCVYGLLCDGIADCVDNSDEDRCPTISTATSAPWTATGTATSAPSTATGTGPGNSTNGPGNSTNAPVAVKQTSSDKKKKILIWAIPVAVVFAALLIGLIYFAVKSRRLQRSFYHLIRSDSFDGGVAYHNTGDDNDVPLIQGFSDDDPLVEA